MDILVVSITDEFWHCSVRIAGETKSLRSITPFWQVRKDSANYEDIEVLLDIEGGCRGGGIGISLRDLNLIGQYPSQAVAADLPSWLTVEGLVGSVLEYFVRTAKIIRGETALALVLPDVSLLRDMWLHRLAEALGFRSDLVFVLWPGMCGLGYWLELWQQQASVSSVAPPRNLNLVDVGPDLGISETWLQDGLIARCNKHNLHTVTIQRRSLSFWTERLFSQTLRGQVTSSGLSPSSSFQEKKGGEQLPPCCQPQKTRGSWCQRHSRKIDDTVSLAKAAEAFCEGVSLDAFVTCVCCSDDTHFSASSLAQIKHLCDPLLLPGTVLEYSLVQGAIYAVDSILLSHITLSIDSALSLSRSPIIYTTIPNNTLAINDEIFNLPYTFLKIEQYRDGCLKSIQGSNTSSVDDRWLAPIFGSTFDAVVNDEAFKSVVNYLISPALDSTYWSNDSVWEPALCSSLREARSDFRGAVSSLSASTTSSPRFAPLPSPTPKPLSFNETEHLKERMLAQISRVQALLTKYATDVVLGGPVFNSLQDFETTDTILSKLEYNLIRSVSACHQ